MPTDQPYWRQVDFANIRKHGREEKNRRNEDENRNEKGSCGYMGHENQMREKKKKKHILIVKMIWRHQED